MSRVFLVSVVPEQLGQLPGRWALTSALKNGIKRRNQRQHRGRKREPKEAIERPVQLE